MVKGVGYLRPGNINITVDSRPRLCSNKNRPHSECYFTLSKSILLRQGSTNRSSGRGSEALLIGLAPALAYFVGSDYAGSR